MNYDDSIQQIIDAIKADKSILSEWRYTAIKRLKEARAFIHEGKTTTYRQSEEPVCNCPEGGVRASCPVHGERS